MKFNVFTGNYPFDIKLGEVDAETPEKALETALAVYATTDDPHPCVQPTAGDTHDNS